MAPTKQNLSQTRNRTAATNARGWQNERGQTTPLMAVMVLLIAFAAMAAAALGRVAIDQARARTAADASALAAATAGSETGQRLAIANGATGVVISPRSPSADDVHVRLSVGDAEAEARAIAPTLPGPDGLTPAMAAALARAEQMLGETVPIVSGYRSPEAQQALWDNRFSNPYPVAPPGTSMHERGLAVDVPSDFVARLLSVAPAVGLCQPLPISDPIHFVFCG